MSDWYRLSVEETLAKVGATRNGLDRGTVIRYTVQHGKNEIPAPAAPALFFIFIKQLLSPFTLLLGISAVISVALAEWIDAWVILVILLANGLLATFFERRTHILTQKLQSLTPRHVKVRRDNQVTVISARDLVPGDIVLLDAGQRIPADCRLVDSHLLRVDESILTGESLPASKDPETIQHASHVADQKNMLFSGTLVTHGKAEAVVVATALNSLVGQLQKLAVHSTPPPSPLAQEIQALNRIIAYAAGIISIVFLTVLTVQHGDLLHALKAAAALGVSAVPEGLPIVVTLGLLLGVHRIAEHKALVKNMTAIDTMGYLTTLVTDKTGTITLNKMRVKTIFLPTNDGATSYEREGINPFTPGLSALLQTAVLANEAALEPEAQKLHDPLETALLEVATDLSAETARLIKTHKPLLIIPFSSEHKFMAACYRMNHNEVVWHLKGAPEVMLHHSTEVHRGGHRHELSKAEHKHIADRIEEAGHRGEKVLACAARITSHELYEQIKKHPETVTTKLLNKLCFLGALGLEDPLRSDAARTIEKLRELGITVKIATGDHAATARAIAHDVGLPLELASHHQLSNLTVKEISERSIFARVHPADKVRIVQALQRRGQVVAMTGDGVNDAPALNQADIGITLGRSGTDASRDIADVILLNDSLSTILTAVRQGRMLTQNLRLITLALVGTAVMEVSAILISTFFSPGTLTILLPTQILWLNLFTGTPLAFPLLYEERDTSELITSKNGRARFASLLPYVPLAGIAIAGLLITTLCLFFGTLAIFPDRPELAQTLSFYALCLGEIGIVFSLKQPGRNIHKSWHGNTVLIIVAIVIAGIQVLTVVSPALQNLLHLVPVTFNQFLVAVLASTGGIIAADIYKTLERPSSS